MSPKKPTPLTDTKIRNAKPNIAASGKNAGKPMVTRLYDGASPGLQVVITGAGSKSFAYRFVSPTVTKVDGKGATVSARRTISLGQYPAMSLEEAREAIEVHRNTIRRGIDPIDQEEHVMILKDCRDPDVLINHIETQDAYIAELLHTIEEEVSYINVVASPLQAITGAFPSDEEIASMSKKMVKLSLDDVGHITRKVKKYKRKLKAQRAKLAKGGSKKGDNYKKVVAELKLKYQGPYMKEVRRLIAEDIPSRTAGVIAKGEFLNEMAVEYPKVKPTARLTAMVFPTPKNWIKN